MLVVEPKIHANHGRIRLVRVTAPGIGARVTGVYRTFEPLIHEIGKFGVVGAVNYVIDVGLFNILVTMTLKVAF